MFRAPVVADGRFPRAARFCRGSGLPWEWLDARREHVLVSLGTVTRESGGRFLRVTVEALEPFGHRLRAIDEPSFRTAAGRLRQDFVAAAGGAAAADRLLELIASGW